MRLTEAEDFEMRSRFMLEGKFFKAAYKRHKKAVLQIMAEQRVERTPRQPAHLEPFIIRPDRRQQKRLLKQQQKEAKKCQTTIPVVTIPTSHPAVEQEIQTWLLTTQL